MIKQLITFDGGLSTKTAPNLIATNEAVECKNVDLEEGTLKAIKDKLYVQDVTGVHGYYKDGSYIFNSDVTDDRFYAEFADTVYWSNGSFNTNGLMKYDGTQAGVAATPPPSPNQIATTGVAGGILEGSYTYCYTFVDSSYLEGTPSGFSTVTLTANQKTEITINPTNVPTDCVSVNIYRTGGANPTFNLIGELAYTSITGSAVFTDNTRDIDVSRVELTTFENTPPPENLDMLIESNGTFWGASGDRVYFSRSGSPYFWGSLDWVRLDSQVTGLGKIGDAIVAFTYSDMYRIDGWHRDNIVKTKLPYNQGCKNKRTVCNVDNYLFWVSDNGICLYDGANVVVVTKQLLEWNEFARVGNSTWGDYIDERYNSGLGYEIIYAKAYQDKFYGVYADGIVVIDTSNGIKASTIYGEDVYGLVVNREENVISYIENGSGQYKLYTIASDTSNATAIWKTGELADEGISLRKFYRKVRVIGDLGSDNKITVYIDSTPVLEISDRYEFFIPSGKSGYTIQFKIETNGEISGLNYEYTLQKVR